MRTSTLVKVFNFQDSKHKTDFGTSRGRTDFHLLKEPVGKQYPEVLRILVPLDILVPLEISAQFVKHSLRSTENFSRSLTKKSFFHL